MLSRHRDSPTCFEDRVGPLLTTIICFVSFKISGGDKSWSWTLVGLFLGSPAVTPGASDSSISPDSHDDEEKFFCEDVDYNHENDGDDNNKLMGGDGVAYRRLLFCLTSDFACHGLPLPCCHR